jgi:hypothetical protein
LPNIEEAMPILARSVDLKILSLGALANVQKLFLKRPSIIACHCFVYSTVMVVKGVRNVKE